MEPATGDRTRIDRALGWLPTEWTRAATGRGETPSAARWIVVDGARRAFVKVGATEVTARLFRREHENYGAIRASFMPRLLGYFDDGVRPVLAVEDLSHARWPPPWRPGDVEGVLGVLGALHAIPPPAHLDRVEADRGMAWRTVAEEPARWAALGLCSVQWLERALPVLISAAAEAPLHGDALVHLDVRSDNICFDGERVMLVDWPEAAIANPDLDIAFWLPSLESDGGPAPESILPNAPELAAWVAGFFFSRAALPPIRDAPHVRPLQLAQSRTALPWAARQLGLPHPE
jgi:hypothetical protein